MADGMVANWPERYGGPVTVQIDGFAALQQNLLQISDAMLGRAANALREECEIEMTEAKQRTPVEFGALRASGHVQGPDMVPGQAVEAVLGFGGPAGAGNLGETNDEDVGYAVYVHEDMEALHHVGQAKFLESTLRESAPYLAARVARRMAQE